MECKRFKYKKYKNCSFRVGNYMNNRDSMSIEILDENGEQIKVCTTNMPEYMYQKNTATIKNYLENAGMTDFLIDLDIIERINTRKNCNIYASKKETIDYCDINIEELKKYTSEFNYKFD